MRRIQSQMIAGPAGRLESLLEEPEHGDARGVALVCHPHPRHGGTMHNKVVYRMARGLRAAGLATLRFNYRGVNLSEGAYDHGVGEIEDARTALRWLRDRYPGLPYTLAGFSFGSRIVLKLGGEMRDAARVISVGLPTGDKDYTYLWTAGVRRVFIQSTHDEYGPRRELEALLATVPDHPELHLIRARDHFFAGALDKLEEAIQTLA